MWIYSSSRPGLTSYCPAPLSLSKALLKIDFYCGSSLRLPLAGLLCRWQVCAGGRSSGEGNDDWQPSPSNQRAESKAFNAVCEAAAADWTTCSSPGGHSVRSSTVTPPHTHRDTATRRDLLGGSFVEEPDTWTMFVNCARPVLVLVLAAVARGETSLLFYSLLLVFIIRVYRQARARDAMTLTDLNFKSSASLLTTIKLCKKRKNSPK